MPDGAQNTPTAEIKIRVYRASQDKWIDLTPKSRMKRVWLYILKKLRRI